MLSKSVCWKMSSKIVGMKVIVQVEMNVIVLVELIDSNVRPIRSENFEQSIRQCDGLYQNLELRRDVLYCPTSFERRGER